MKQTELIELRRLVEEERKRRIEIKDLLNSHLVRQYLNLTDTAPVMLDSGNTREIIENILRNFPITKTNGIYVCIKATKLSYDVDKKESYDKNVEIDSKKVGCRIYKDIESGLCCYKRNGDYYELWPEDLMYYFERDNIVLNPYNSFEDENGYQDVRLDFFENSINIGQEKSKQLLLKKYPKL